MPAIAVPFRLKPRDLAFGEAFQAHHQARVDRPIDDLDLTELFRDVQANLKPGDWVRVVAYKDNLWQQVMEGRTAIIVSSRQEIAGGPKVTRAVWMDDFFKVPAAELVTPANQPKVRLNVKREFGGSFSVQDEKGNVVESFKTKAECVAYIDNLNREPRKVAAA
jgi:hypothetical protein